MQKRVVIVLGSQGMLGSAVARYLSAAGWKVLGTQQADPDSPGYFDVTLDLSPLSKILAENPTTPVINCIGILQSDINGGDNASLFKALEVNALFPHRLAAIASSYDSRVIHISTDGVFAPGRNHPLSETDYPDCTDNYGRTKILGECCARNVLNLRCSIIGRDQRRGKGLLEWLLRQPDYQTVDGYVDTMWNGVSTLQIAELCDHLAEATFFDETRSFSPTYHFCPNQAISKYELLCLWREICKRNITIRSESKPGTSRLLCTCFENLTSRLRPNNDWLTLLTTLKLYN